MALPEKWFELPRDEAVKLEVELRRELLPTHQLFGRDLQAIARRGHRDDVLFASSTGDGAVFWVHLTWSRETDPTWPWTVAYRDIADFVERWPLEEPDGNVDDAG